MKFIISLCIFLTLTAVASNANSVPFKSCSDGSLASVSNIDLTPYPIQKGNPLTVNASGTLNEELTAGTFNLIVKFLGIQIYTTSGDLCSQPGFSCPKPAGPLVIYDTATIPGIAPAGSYEIVINVTDQKGAVLLCLDIPIQIQSPVVMLSPVTPNEILLNDEKAEEEEEEELLREIAQTMTNKPIKPTTTTKPTTSARPVEVPSIASLDGPAVRQEVIDYVNAVQNQWRAGPQSRFNRHTLRQAKGLCGALKEINPLPVKRDLTLVKIKLPESFDARDNWPNCTTIGKVRDQGSCGSCWAFGAAEAMTDRVCIASKGTNNAYLSAEDLVSCCGPFTCGSGCDGGYPSGAWQYFQSTGLVTGGDYDSNQGCLPYEIPACDHHVNGSLPACGDTLPTPACKKSCTNGANWKADKHFGASAYAVSSSPVAIQNEILTNGPVEAAFTVYEDFLAYQSGVYSHTSGQELGGHAVKILGWGTENGTPYWTVANSWNADWGDKGFLKIQRGNDECGIESQIAAGIPKV
jgi:cathepsin B